MALRAPGSAWRVGASSPIRGCDEELQSDSLPSRRVQSGCGCGEGTHGASASEVWRTDRVQRSKLGAETDISSVSHHMVMGIFAQRKLE